MQRPQSSPSYLIGSKRRLPVSKLGNYSTASELYELSKRPPKVYDHVDPNRAQTQRKSRSPRAHRLPQSRPASAAVGSNLESKNPEQNEVIRMGAGVTMSKSSEKISVMIRTDSPMEKFAKRKTPEQNLHEKVVELEILISELRMQIDDLIVALEEEKISHKLTRQSAAEEMVYQLREIKEGHLDEIHDVKREYSYQLDDQKRKFDYQLEKNSKEYQILIDEKKIQLDIVEKAFEAYKATIADDVARKIARIEEELKRKFEAAQADALKDLREKLTGEHEAVVAKLERKHENEMKLMIHEKDREKQELIKNFSEAAQDLHKFQLTLQELDSLKAEHENNLIETRALKKEVQNKNREISELKLKVADFETNFQKKVNDVEEKFWIRAEGMMNENTDIKRRYNAKCSELFTVKAETASWSRDKAYSAVETMQTLVEARAKAGVQINCSDLRITPQAKIPFERSLSAPLTECEEHHAKLCAGMHVKRRGRTMSTASYESIDSCDIYDNLAALPFKSKLRPKSSFARIL